MNPTQTKEYIVNSLDLGKLSLDEQNKVIQKLESEVEEKAFISIINSLGENERKELLALAEKRSQIEIHNFIEEKIPNVKEIIKKTARQTVENFRKRI